MRSSPRASRHLACNLCRDRKVKCDGGKPLCGKCVKAGEVCSYSTGVQASRAELQHTILQLHERLEQTQANQAALLAQQQALTYYGSQSPAAAVSSPLQDSLAMLEQQQQGLVDHPPLDVLSSRGCSTPGSFSHNSATVPNAMLSLDSLPESAKANPYPLLQQAMAPKGHHNPTPMGTDMMTSPAFMGDPGLAGGFTVGGLLSPPPGTAPTTTGRATTATSSSVASLPEQQQPLACGLPSLRDVQTWNLQASSFHSEGGDEVARLLDEFICLASVTELAQQDIIGVADTAALYSSYFRHMVRLDGSGGAQSAEELSHFLWTLETRMREISDIASRNVLGQARRSREAVASMEACRARMKQVEAELHRRAQDKADLFGHRYNLTTPLSEQEHDLLSEDKQKGGGSK